MKPSRELTRKEQGAVRKLVTAICANYDKTYDCCPLLDDYGCYQFTRQFTGSGVCKYFKNAVLPLNPALEAIFSDESARRCVLCGGKYIPTGRSQKYCPACKEAAKKSAAAKRARKYRQNREVKHHASRLKNPYNKNEF